jgi:hypothetical protein
VRLGCVLEGVRQQHGVDRPGRDRQRVILRPYGPRADRIRCNPATMLRARTRGELAAAAPGPDAAAPASW